MGTWVASYAEGVDERDVAGMAEHMIRLAGDPQLAGKIGRAASTHVREKYSMQRSIDNLRNIIGQCVASARKPAVAAGS